MNCKYIKREGESCTLNNNCKYPHCLKDKTNSMKKADKIFIRIGFEDAVVPIEEGENTIKEVTEQYFVGYEDEEGNECKEDGTYLKPNYN